MYGAGDVRVENVPASQIKEATDALAIALLLILTIPEISLDAEEIQESKPSKSTVSNENLHS